MFCMGCGAEAPFGAFGCPVCGRELGGNNGDARHLASATAQVGVAHSSPPSVTYSSHGQSGPVALGPGLGSTVAGQDLPGIPRDTTGRVVLVTAIAMAADLLVPWAVVNGEHRAIASVGALALLSLPALGAALLPLFNPTLRRKPVYAVLPLIVGALCVGVGCTLWAALTYLSYKLSFITLAGSGDVSSQGGSFLSLSPDVGVYLFILGGAVLGFTGYRFFLEAASGAGAETNQTSHSPASVAQPQLLLPALPPYLQPQAGVAAYPAHASVPLTASVPLANVGAIARPNGISANPASPIAAQAGPSIPSLPAADLTQHNGAGTSLPNNGPLHVPVPGSAEWNEAPHQPEYARPSPGWHRGPRVRR